MKVLNLILLLLGQTIASQKRFENKPKHHQLAIKNLVGFLKFDTSHPNPNYNGTVKYLENIANQLNLKFTQFKCQPSGTPSVVLTWPGTDKNLPSVVLNSHYDVVPVIKDHWTYEPFNATITKDKEGYDSIYARGSQDVKSLGIMYIEAIRKLKSEMKAGPLRTVHILFVADEETGGNLGMKCFSSSPEWKKTFGEIGILLDEGFPSNEKRTFAFYGERVQRGFKVIARGNTGHASQFISDLATDKMTIFQAKMRLYRYQEERKMKHKKLELGDVTTVNLDMMKSGTAINVVPDMVEAWYDVRANPKVNLKELQAKFETFAKEANVTYEQISKDEPHFTVLEGNPFWENLKKKGEEFGLPLSPAIFPAATDSRHLRVHGVNAIGLTPINNHPVLAHANDEYIRIDSFLKGIDFYIHCLPSLFQLPESL